MLLENKAANQLILSPVTAMLEGCKLVISFFEAHKRSRCFGNDSCLLGAYIDPTHRPYHQVDYLSHAPRQHL